MKVFPSSRGEFTIQPERSGHYIFRFTQLSDANYKKVPLDGPSIDQVVHPPASADFAHNVNVGRPGMGGRGGRKKISSCEGNKVDVEVDLKVRSRSVGFVDPGGEANGGVRCDRVRGRGIWICKLWDHEGLRSCKLRSCRSSARGSRFLSLRLSTRTVVPSRLISVSLMAFVYGYECWLTGTSER